MSPLEHFEQNKANIFWLYLEHSANIFTIWITLQIYSLFGALCKYIHYLEHSASIFRYIWSTLQIYLLFWSLCKYISLDLEHSANIFTISITLQIYFVIFGASCQSAKTTSASHQSSPTAASFSPPGFSAPSYLSFQHSPICLFTSL